MIDLVRSHCGLGSQLLAGIFAPSSSPARAGRSRRESRSSGSPRTLPPPPAYASPPAAWGRVEHVEQLLAEHPVRLGFERHALHFEAESPATFVDFLADFYGPVLGARNRLSADGRWEQLRGELIALSNEMNLAGDGHFRAPSEYLVTLAGKLA